jgi:hypothetical protein
MFDGRCWSAIASIIAGNCAAAVRSKPPNSSNLAAVSASAVARIGLVMLTDADECMADLHNRSMNLLNVDRFPPSGGKQASYCGRFAAKMRVVRCVRRVRHRGLSHATFSASGPHGVVSAGACWSPAAGCREAQRAVAPTDPLAMSPRGANRRTPASGIGIIVANPQGFGIWSIRVRWQPIVAVAPVLFAPVADSNEKLMASDSDEAGKHWRYQRA